MRRLAFSAFAALVILANPAFAQSSKSKPSDALEPLSPPATRNITSTGETKPPGAALPEGPSRIDELEKKSEALGRRMENSVCKC